jgi:hypothetical protein
MTYVEWNNHIATLFFKPVNAGKYIAFYLTRQDLIKSAYHLFSGSTEDEIWADFIYAIKYDQQANSSKIQYSPITRPFELSSQWNKIDTPPFIAFLILYIIPLTESYEEHFNASNYYGKVNVFFKRNGILSPSTEESISTGNFQHISNLWNQLEEWSIITKNCDLGIFELKKFGNPNWIHVGKPFSQCVLPPSAINKLPELFNESGLIPDSAYSRAEFRKILLRNGIKILGLKESVIELLRSKNELGQSIIEIVIREYNKWTGETHQDNGALQQIKRNYTVAPLFLQFKVNENEGRISLSYRMYSSNDYPEDLKFGEYDNLYETNGWSKTLSIEFKEPLELKDDFNKWVARFPEREIRLFINAATFQLSAGYWIETEVLSKTDSMFLLCKSSIKDSIINWGKSFKQGNFREQDLEGLPENYSLFKILSPVESHPTIPILTLYTEKRIELIDGLRISFRTFINDFLPDVEITNSDGNEKVYLQYRNTEEKIFLQRKQSNNNRWLLPKDVLLNVDFNVKVEGEHLAGNELAFNFVSSKDSSIKIDGIQLPKRDSFGRQTNNDLKQHCLGNNIINPSKASQRYYCAWENLFLSINEDSTTQIKQAVYDNNCGNMLSSFLTTKNILTTEEFYRAFEFYYFKEFAGRQLSENFNLTRIKKASLNFYDYIGFLDFDYETKKIVVCPPQLIFIPCTMGRKVLLIGGRDASLIKSIINIAPKHNLQVEITKQFSSNERLLLPDVITIKSLGKSDAAYGERNIVSFSNEMKIKISTNDFCQIGLKLFSAEICEYEKELIDNNETSEEDYGWARRIFNPDSLKYDKNESPTFDRDFALIEYKLNEYTYYNKLWKAGKCYQVDKNWGKYLALKYYGKNVILFDRNHSRVAIPWETPLPRLLAKSIVLLSGLGPDYREIDGRYYRVYENIPSVFTENLFRKLAQKPINIDLQ